MVSVYDEAFTEVAIFANTTPEFAGGGRGQIAYIDNPTWGRVEGRGPNKGAALTQLLENLRAAQAIETPKRTDLERVLDLLEEAGHTPDILTTDDGSVPGPKWKGGKIVKLWPCVAECMTSTSTACSCKCGGKNHVANARVLEATTPAQLAAAIAETAPVQYGEKPCLCGCGETTMRRFRPGHDARYHAAQKRAAAAASQTA